MNKIRVICLGEVLIDYIANQIGSSLTEVKSWTGYPGGAVTNVACALVNLGTSSAYIGCVGSDQIGQELVQLLNKIGVNTTGVVFHPDAPTRRIYVLRTKDGDRVFAGFGDYPPDIFADTYLDATTLPEKLFKEADFLVLGTLELAYHQTGSAIWRALELANYYNLKVLVDVNWRPVFWSNPQEAKPLIRQLLKFTNFLKLSATEAEWLFNTTDVSAIADSVDSLEGVLITDGPREVSYYLGNQPGKIQPKQFKVKDTTGAGDSFVAGFLHQLCQRGLSALNDPPIARKMVNYACIIGGISTTRLGAIYTLPKRRSRP